MGLAKDQKDEIDAAFARYGKGGSLDVAKSLGPAVRSVGLNPTEAELADWKKEAGKKLDQSKFTSFATEKLEAANDSLEEILDAFKSFDTSGSGALPLADFMHIIKNMGEALSEDEIAEVMKEAEVVNGVIEYGNFATMIFGG
jgi:calmodulin